MKRGSVPETTTKKGKDYPVGPVLLGFFVFVVIGSCKFVFKIILVDLSFFVSHLIDGGDDDYLFLGVLTALFQIIRTATSGGMA